MKKLEVKKYGIEQDFNGVKSRLMTGVEADLEKVVEKVNEIVDWINSKKDQLL